MINEKGGGAEAAKWNKILEEQGMPDELGPDKAARALWLEKLAEKGIPNGEEMINKMRAYFAYANSPHPGEHKQFMQGLAAQFGLPEWELDEDLVESVREEVAAAERSLSKVRGKPKIVKFKLIHEQFPDFPEEVIDAVIDAEEVRRAA